MLCNSHNYVQFQRFVIVKCEFNRLLNLAFLALRHLKMEFRSCARGRQWCGIITTVKQLKKTKAAVFFVQAMIPEGFPFHQLNLRKTVTEVNFSSWIHRFGRQKCKPLYFIWFWFVEGRASLLRMSDGNAKHFNGSVANYVHVKS